MVWCRRGVGCFWFFFAWICSRLSRKCYILTRFNFILFWRTSDLLLNSTQILIKKMSVSGVSWNTPGRACIWTARVSGQSPSDWVPYLSQKVEISIVKKGKDTFCILFVLNTITCKNTPLIKYKNDEYVPVISLKVCCLFYLVKSPYFENIDF